MMNSLLIWQSKKKKNSKDCKHSNKLQLNLQQTMKEMELKMNLKLSSRKIRLLSLRLQKCLRLSLLRHQCGSHSLQANQLCQKVSLVLMRLPKSQQWRKEEEQQPKKLLTMMRMEILNQKSRRWQLLSSQRWQRNLQLSNHLQYNSQWQFNPKTMMLMYLIS